MKQYFNISSHYLPDFQKEEQLSIQKKQGITRDSNIELLRIVAMFLVLVVHADFFSLGSPTKIDVVSNPFPSFSRFFFQSLSVICVDVFILISGWFGIKPSLKGWINFVFQASFYSLGIYILFSILGLTSFSLNTLCRHILFVHGGMWFIVSYMGLYILSPVLNMFSENISKGQFRLFLICYFLFQFLYGWVIGISEFDQGYSILSFVGLYLLARYVRLYPSFLIMLRTRTYGLIFFIACYFGRKF